jgi:hypothetical protein
MYAPQELNDVEKVYNDKLAELQSTLDKETESRKVCLWVKGGVEWGGRIGGLMAADEEKTLR